MMRRLLPLLILAATHASASACATCGIDPNSTFVAASNSVLWTLLGLVGFIFFSTGVTAFYLWRRTNAPIPPHVQLVEKMTEATDESEED